MTASKIRDIIEIDETLCDGCGQCLTNCAEGALALVDGKARLVSDVYCDGLGACLGHCPAGALKIIRREAPDFNEEAALAQARAQSPAGGCPGSRAVNLAEVPRSPRLGRSSGAAAAVQRSGYGDGSRAPALAGLVFWPIQLRLAPPAAPAFDAPVLILASACSGFTGPAFHRTFLTEGYPLVMACPKLDEVEPQIEKLAAILKGHPSLKELKVPMMNVPCCGGLGRIATQAVQRAGRQGDVTWRAWIVTPEGQVTEEHIR